MYVRRGVLGVSVCRGTRGRVGRSGRKRLTYSSVQRGPFTLDGKNEGRFGDWGELKTGTFEVSSPRLLLYKV